MVVYDPTPVLFRCPSCGWRAVLKGRGDVRMLNDNYFKDCPECQAPGVTETRRAEPGLLKQIQFQLLLSTSPDLMSDLMRRARQQKSDEA
jgi:predicted RNA-binding Zn-ribbon protein involved in translation (DUF1610 family)